MKNVLNKRKTCFLYGRVSSDEQALYGDSLRAQIEEFLKMDLENIYYTLTPLERRRLWLSIIREIRIERNIVDIDFL